MKHLLKISTLTILSVTFCATLATADESPNLSYHCGDQNSPTGDGGQICGEGMVTFQGQHFPSDVDIRVMSYPVGDLIDSAIYSTSGEVGQLEFTQTLVPAGSYMVVVSEAAEGGAELATLMVTVNPVN